MLRYGEEDLAGAKSLVDQCPSDDPDTEMNLACLLAKEGRLQVSGYFLFEIYLYILYR
jgi:tetratricopeptide repeat protein 30